MFPGRAAPVTVGFWPIRRFQLGTRRYRKARPAEHRALVFQDAEAFGDSTASPAIDRSLTRTPLDELRVLEENGTTLGLLLARSRPVFWGGRPVPASQVSGLSVGAEHRGRGAATALLRAYLAEAAEAGAAVSTLFPATVQLYRRLGYEYAGTWTLYEAAATCRRAGRTGTGSGRRPPATRRPCGNASPGSPPAAPARSCGTTPGGGTWCSATGAPARPRCSWSTGRTARTAGRSSS